MRNVIITHGLIKGFLKLFTFHSLTDNQKTHAENILSVLFNRFHPVFSGHVET